MTAPLVDILLVDDNPAKGLALQTALAPLGQRMVMARSGREALKHLLEQAFAPVILVSAINLAETDALRGYALGAVDYIFAPIIPEVLRAKVSVFVELYRKTEEA